MNKTPNTVQKILKFTCPDCSANYELIETHQLNKGCCGNCPPQWGEIIQNYHQEQCLAYLARKQAVQDQEEE